MKRTSKYLFCILAFIGLIMSVLSFQSGAYAGLYFETESNDTISSADTTEDDYNAYGRISSQTDVDFWSLTFTAEGFANFWLGNIPSGTNYELQIYTNSGRLMVESLNLSNAAEICRVHVKANTTYRIKVYSSSGYSDSSYYLLRAKSYELKDAMIFTTSDLPGTRADASLSFPYIWNMGYEGQEYLDNDAATAYTALTQADIFVATNHGAAGKMLFYNSTYFYGLGTNTTYNKVIQQLPAGALNDVRMIWYYGCNTGLTDTTYGNIVDETLAKGANSCFGWKQTINVYDCNRFIEHFFALCDSNENVGNAYLSTRNWVISNYSSFNDYDSIIDVYYGSSRLWALQLDS